MSFKNALPGELITFGTYPHKSKANDQTPIGWIVLENSATELLILSKFILDCKRYHGEFEATSWRDCDLRKWLNNEFYNSAFTAAEKKLIKTTRSTSNGVESPDTMDKVFLLSPEEVNRVTDSLGKDFRRARGTEFAKLRRSDGCHLYVMDKNVEADYITENRKRHGCSWWWLRTQGKLKDKGYDPSRAMFIGTQASIRHYARVNQTGDGVRPAMKLRMSK